MRIPTYFGSMLLVGRKLQAFSRRDTEPRRIRRLAWTPYFTDGVLAGVAGLLNPAGLFYVIASALPSTLGANAGLLSLPGMMRRWSQPAEPVDTIQRSPTWIATAAIAVLLFIFVLGRGLTWSR